jgi:hypothetical protein
LLSDLENVSDSNGALLLCKIKLSALYFIQRSCLKCYNAGKESPEVPGQAFSMLDAYLLQKRFGRFFGNGNFLVLPYVIEDGYSKNFTVGGMHDA